MQVSTEHLLTFDLPHSIWFSLIPTQLLIICMKYEVWQSQVEVEHYSFAYFDRVTTICSAELLLRTRLIQAT